jgi:hypothetical protein
MRARAILHLGGLVAILAIAVQPATASAATQSRDDPSDAPNGALGKADLRTVTWDVSGATAKLTVSVDASTYPVDLRAQIGVHVLIDTDRDGTADAEVVATRDVDGVAIDVQVRGLDRTLSTETCQDLAGKAIGAPATLSSTVAGGLETFSYTFDPTVLPGGLASFRWAVFGQAPPDGAVGGPWDVLPDAATVDPADPNPGDERCDASKSGVRVRIKNGVAFPDPVVPPPPIPAHGPVAALALAGGQPKAGAGAVLDASRSTAGSAAHVVAYQWDMNGDGHLDTNTGHNPIAHLIIGSRAQTVVVHVIDSAGATASASIVVSPSPSSAGCLPDASIGVLRIRAQCIRHDGADLVAEPGLVDTRSGFGNDYAVSLNGIALVTHDPHATVRFDMARHEIAAHGHFRVMVLNAPQGDMVFLETGDSGFTWPMPAGGGNAHGEPSRILSFQVSHSCHDLVADYDTGGLRPVCAEVPGGFPLTGEIGLGVDTTTYDAIFDVNLTVGRDVTGTGRVRMRASIVLGSLVLDSVGFEIAGATIGPVTLNHLRFSYEQPGTGNPLHEGDQWDAAVGIETSNLFEAEGRMIFVDGQFNYMSADLTFQPGILVYPAVFLNRFAAEIGVNPFRYGGGLGANFATLVQVNANFLYAYLPDRTIALRMDGTASVKGIPLASAYSEIWSNGYMTMGGGIGIRYPSGRTPVITLVGRVDMWFEAEPDNSVRFQGGSTVDVGVGPLSGRVVAFVNNDWFAGCFDRFLTVAYNWNTRVASSMLGCDLTPFSFEPLHDRGPLRPAAAAAGDAPAKAFTVAPGQRALVLGVDAASGAGTAPKVTLTDPHGHVYTPSDTPDRPFADGGFRSFYATGSESTLLRVEHPIAGEWTLTPRAGSTPIDKVRSADALPPLHVSAHVRGKGRFRTLTWRASGLAGRSVRFAEHGKNTGRTIVETKKASGSVRFAVQDGSAGVRKVEAFVGAGVLPVAAPVVARYKAPGLTRPGRPGKLKAKRKGETITISWPRLRGARGYLVAVRGSDGRRELHLMTGRKHLVRILTVGHKTKLTVRVAGWVSSERAPGPARALRVRRA